MSESISPKYQMKLINEVDQTIWAEFGSYVQVRFYMEKWLSDYEIREREAGKIDLLKTLHNTTSDILIKIAINLGLETPNYIPSMPTFKNELKNNFETAYDTFVKAQKQVETDPSTAIGLANSTLESIIKEILIDDEIQQNISLSGNETTGKLIKLI